MAAVEAVAFVNRERGCLDSGGCPWDCCMSDTGKVGKRHY